MKQQTLTFNNFDDAMLLERKFILPESYKKLHVDCSMISPGTELFCIREAIKSGSPVQPGYILAGTDDTGQRCFLFPSLAESSACHCNLRAVGPDSLLLSLPTEISSENAGFIRFINIGMHAFNQLSKLPETVCVIGLGPVGNMAAQTGRLLGCHVVGVDLSSNRRNIASECGIATVIAPEQLADYKKDFDLVIDTVASSSSLTSAAAILKNGGECSMIGIIKDGNLKASEILSEAWQRQLIFRSGWEMLNPIKKQHGDRRVSTEENIIRAVNWIKIGGYRLSPLLTGVIYAEISAIKRAYKQLNDKPDDNMCFAIKWR